MAHHAMRGFTLIEMSIVLVIIGLIVGGILVGQDLVRSAGERAQITQIEKYNTAVNNFRAKYGALPGDLNQQVASAFGFTSRGINLGEGDGNGVIEGVNELTANDDRGYYQDAGENLMFWVDLTTANGLNVNMIDGTFSSASPSAVIPGAITGAALGNYYPAAKIGNGNYIYVMSGGGPITTWGSPPLTPWVNYFGIEAIGQIGNGVYGSITALPGLTVKQAYDMDMKMDDGLPQSGNVIAVYNSDDDVYWAVGGGNIQGDGAHGATGVPVGHSFAVPGSSTTCYDNNNSAANPIQYSLTQSGGMNVNCALTFRFQ